MAFVEMFFMLTFVGVLLYRWSMGCYSYFGKRNVAFVKAKPLLGNVPLSVMMGSASYLRHSIELHQQLKQHKLYGIYNMREPQYQLADAELIRQVCVQHAEKFCNHRAGIHADEESESESEGTMLSKMLLSLRNERWQRLRKALTPSFAGASISKQCELLNICSLQAAQHLERQLRSSELENVVELELSEFFTRYVNDVIASAAFGLQVDSYLKPTNEFLTQAQQLSQLSLWGGIKVLLQMMMPKVTRLLKLRPMDFNNVDYFRNLLHKRQSGKQKIMRADMLQQLLQQQSQIAKQCNFSNEDLLAQCLLFITAGWETVASCLSFTCYELLMQPELQQKLYEELHAMEQQLAGKPLDYEALVSLKYLDCVVAEALRKWPPTNTTDRECVEPFELRTAEGETLVQLQKGDLLHIPIAALHHDPDNFEQPMEFIPERFSDEHKAQIKPFSYLPFGLGARSCLGQEFALLQVKSLLYQLLLKFQLLPCERTTQDMLNSLAGFSMQPRELFWCKIAARGFETEAQ
ncbi:Cyp9c1 [Drosophila busckii]|uniref:Cyp9c1 n=1 Tax=Drosophila busckii TaxID=30019 RepID=A0A0M5IZL1_DROBS|nr:cytochrome P450 9c1 [Drosophila busckii]ALC40824.1 Cyp9c1 [Drosophila busckii]